MHLPLHIIFFDRLKPFEKHILEKKGRAVNHTGSIQRLHKRETSQTPQKRNKPAKRETIKPNPYIVTKASKKSFIFTACTFELAIARDHRAKIREFFIHWVEGTKSSKTTPFLSCQIVHSKHKGRSLPNFFQGFYGRWTFPPYQSILMDLGKTQLTPKIAKIRAQRL